MPPASRIRRLPEPSVGVPDDGQPLLAFRGLALGYRRVPAVRGLDGEVRRGSTTAVVGPNGAGKSTLLKGIVGMLRPLAGQVDRAGLSQSDIAYLPQVSEIDRGFPASVFNLVALGLWSRLGAFGKLTGADRAAVDWALSRVGLSGFQRRSIGTLSGGEMQRALFARVLLQDAPLILLDEPFNAIDGGTIDDLLVVIGAWRDEGRTVLAVLHDLDLVRAFFPETLLLAGKPVAWGRTSEVLRAENLASARRGEFHPSMRPPERRSAA